MKAVLECGVTDCQEHAQSIVLLKPIMHRLDSNLQRTFVGWVGLLLLTVVGGCGNRNQRVSDMAGDQPEVPAEIKRFHQIVEQGTLEELSQELSTGVDVNAPGRFGETALMVAVRAVDLPKIKLLVEHGADPEQTDEFNSTSLSHAVDGDYAAGVKYLISLGVDRGFHPKYPLKQVNYQLGNPLDISQQEMPEELRGVMSETEWKASLQETMEMISEMDSTPRVVPYISEVQSTEVLKLFLEAGDDLSLASDDTKRAYMGLKKSEEGDDFQATRQEYQKHRSPSYGTCNPEPIDNRFWSDMIRLGCNAYVARKKFEDTDSYDTSSAVWCYDRFGSSVTELADGRFVQIAGEHEDHYDPDFFIYNDVVIHDGQGDFQIYGYPKDVFPPTDFHTATLVKNWIYIIGCLGYPEQREEMKTPVYRLELETWRIEPVKTSGNPPRWLHKHRASFDPEKNTIRVEGGDLHIRGKDKKFDVIANEDQFEFDLSSSQWRKVE